MNDRRTHTGLGIMMDIEPTYGFKDNVEYKDSLFKKAPYK
jgi:hypothetical protein